MGFLVESEAGRLIYWVELCIPQNQVLAPPSHTGLCSACFVEGHHFSAEAGLVLPAQSPGTDHGIAHIQGGSSHLSHTSINSLSCTRAEMVLDSS